MNNRELFDNTRTIWILIGSGVALLWAGLASLVIRIPAWALIASAVSVLVLVAWFGSWLEQQKEDRT